MKGKKWWKAGRKAHEFSGQRFGRLVAIEPIRKPRQNGKLDVFWKCQCDCGKEKLIASGSLKSGATQSCGCLQSELCSERMSKTCLIHGASYSPEYRAWRSMLARCYNKNTANYSDYGGRGISVCSEWRDSFSDFINHIGDRPSPLHSLDRFPNNDGNYEPGNVRWATAKEQQQNRRANHWIEFNGESLILSEWARRFGMRPGTLSNRLKYWNNDIQRVLLTPLQKKTKTRKVVA